MNAVSLVDHAIKDRTCIKKVGPQLEALPANLNAVQKLITAYEKRVCEPWVAAYLLGCIRHPLGYDTAKAILLSNARSSSEGYAAVAMAKIRGLLAYDDLRDIVFGNYPKKVRQGAVCGMSTIQAPRALDDLLMAFDEKRLSLTDISIHAAKCVPSDEWLLQLMQSNGVAHRKLACAIVASMLSQNVVRGNPGIRVANSVRIVLLDQAFCMPPRRRDTLAAWAT